MTPLAFESHVAEGAAPQRAFVFLHGILGQGANWRTFARRFVERLPQFRAILVDLPEHGASGRRDADLTVMAAAQAVVESVAHEVEQPLAGVLGHSFGGKVGLAIAERAKLQHLVSIDSLPGELAGTSATTAEVLSVLRETPPQVPSRGAFIDSVTDRGLSRRVGQWLAMNLVRVDDGGFRFGLDLPRIEALIEDYLALDLWRVVETPPDGLVPHLIVGGRSSVFDGGSRKRVARLADQGTARLDVIEEADHWVHVDAPQETLQRVIAAIA